MISLIVPAIWLIVLIAGLPQLSETVYTPSLPDIAHALRASESMVEFTLTIFLFGFAIGTLFWGILSDRHGRKPCIIGGLIIFILGCLGCYYATDINMLLISRFIQAFGGSVGSVLGQAICRDAFHGPALGKAYSSIGSALAIFPAVGPVIGGFIAQSFGWANIFLFLTGFGVILTLLVVSQLPETHTVENRIAVSKIDVALQLIKDKKVIGFGLIVAACNGICFSYFAEGSFNLINILGLSPSQYGSSFIAIATCTMLGGILSKRLHSTHTSQTIMLYGLLIILGATALSTGLTFWHTHMTAFSATTMVGIIITAQMCTMFGVCMATSNALALALTNYKWCIGTASSFFGFFYYCSISLFTLGIGCLHTGSILVMPLYFLAIAIFMLIIEHTMIRA